MEIRSQIIPETRDFILVFFKEIATAPSTYVWYAGWLSYYGACFYLFDQAPENSRLFVIEHLVFFSVVILLALPIWLLTTEAKHAARKARMFSPLVLSAEALSISFRGVCKTWAWSSLKTTDFRECFRFEDSAGERLYIFKRELSSNDIEQIREWCRPKLQSPPPLPVRDDASKG